ncbi:MAG: HTH-type transcriptional regulator BhcR [Paracoccaceae bacterium]
MQATPPRPRGRPKGWDTRPDQTTIRSLDRALEVLDLLANEDGLTLSEIAARLDASPATVYRVLQTCQAHEVTETDPQTQQWHLGPGAFRLGAAFLRRTSLVERARPVMRMLMEATGETANLGIEKGGEVLFLSQVETQESIRAFFPPGTLSPMHASGIGKALLARLLAERRERLLAQPLTRFTERTITDPEALRADLARSVARGWALDDQEKAEGMRCIAAPVFDLHGEVVAGLSVSGPLHRMHDDRLEPIGRAVARAAVTLSQALGAPAR